MRAPDGRAGGGKPGGGEPTRQPRPWEEPISLPMLAFAIAVIGPLGWVILDRGLAYIPEVRTGFGAVFAYGATVSGALILLAALGGLAWIVWSVMRRHA